MYQQIMVSGGEGVTFLNAVDSEQWPLGQKNKSENLPVPVGGGSCNGMGRAIQRKKAWRWKRAELIGKKVSEGGEQETAMT